MQKISADSMSFGGISDTVLNMALRESADCSRVDVVFDVYKKLRSLSSLKVKIKFAYI